METKAAAAVDADKIKHRLEQLDDMEEGGAQETLNLSQQDYVNKIDTMNKSLTTAWQRDQRVVALKISIQVCMFIWSCDIHYVYIFVHPSGHVIYIMYNVVNVHVLVHTSGHVIYIMYMSLYIHLVM